MIHEFNGGGGPGWSPFIRAMNSGELCEVDSEMYDYWLNVLPPIFMAKTIGFRDGTTRVAHFGFAEGAELVVAFWCDASPRRYFCRQTTMMNPCA